MKKNYGEYFSSLLIFEPRQYVVSLWKNNFVQMLPNAHVKVVTNQNDFVSALSNSKYDWSLIVVNWDNQEGSHRWMKEDLSRDEEGCGFKRVATIRAHERYMNTPLVVYTEKEKIGSLSQIYIKDLFNTYLIFTNSAPYGIIEKLKIKLIAEKEGNESSRDLTLIKSVKKLIIDKKHEEALLTLDKLAIDSETILKLCSLKLECLIACERLDEASAMISEMHSLKALSPSILHFASEVFVKNGDYSNAIKFLEVKQKTFPDSGECRIAIAKIQRKSGNIALAKKLLRQELLISNLLHKQVFSELTLILMDEGDYQGVLELADFDDYDINDRVAQEIANKAVILSKEGKCIICISLIEKFMPFINGYIAEGTAFYYIGKTYLEISNYAQAINMLCRSVSIHPDLTPAVKCLIKALATYRGIKDKELHKAYDEELLKSAIRRRARFLSKELGRKLLETEAEALKLFDKNSKHEVSSQKSA